MRKRIIFAAFLFTTIILSCKKTPTEVLKSTLVGTWNIDQCTFVNLSTTATVNNYGTYTFNKDGSGNYIYSTNPGAVNNFTWTNTDTTITTLRNNLTTIINVVHNDSKKQQWSTSTNNVHYDYMLTKK